MSHKRRLLIALPTAALALLLVLCAWIWWGDWPAAGPMGEISNPALVIVLGGGNESRPREALRLAEKFPEPQVLVTGDGGYHQAALVAGGLDPQRMEVEPAASSTLENARFATPWIDDTRGQIVLVTNDFHGPRSLAVFRAAHPGHDFVVASETSDRPFDNWQVNFRRRERAAVVYYLIRYHINSFRN